jgi:hypothetical protein
MPWVKVASQVIPCRWQEADLDDIDRETYRRLYAGPACALPALGCRAGWGKLRMSAVMGGAKLVLLFLLLSAGLMKLATPKSFGYAVLRLLPDRFEPHGGLAKLAALLVGSTEVLTGAGLVWSFWSDHTWSDVAVVGALALYTGFVPVIVVAIRKGVACGCWSSLSDGIAGNTELGRSVALALMAALLAAWQFGGSSHRGWTWTSIPWAIALGAAVAAVAMLAGRVGPSGTRRADPAAIPTQRAFARFLLGHISSTKARLASLPSGQLAPTDRQRYLGAARSSPAVEVLERWLATKGIQIDWGAATTSETTWNLPEAPPVRCAQLDFPVTGALKLSIALPLLDDGSLGEVVAVGTLEGAFFLSVKGAMRGPAVEPPREASQSVSGSG